MLVAFNYSWMARAGGLTDKMVALGDVRRPARCLRISCRGGREVAVHLVQMSAHGVPAVSVADHVTQPVGVAGLVEALALQVALGAG